MKRDPRLYLEDILQAIEAIERYTKGLSKQDFDHNELVQDGVVAIDGTSYLVKLDRRCDSSNDLYGFFTAGSGQDT